MAEDTEPGAMHQCPAGWLRRVCKRLHVLYRCGPPHGRTFPAATRHRPTPSMNIYTLGCTLTFSNRAKVKSGEPTRTIAANNGRRETELLDTEHKSPRLHLNRHPP
ncbi:hypothetical protein CBL_03834 [Carabus blaptoides fortunei]